MLEDVNIRDFALIESVSLDFHKGFTVLSGETGAGKSILIGALSFLLGGKGGTEVIRTGASEALVSGTFLIEDRCTDAFLWLQEHGIELEDNRVLLRRFIKDTGRSGAFIQNTPVTKNELVEFSSFLIDIHGQHEHQSLMKVSEHRKFLDTYAGINAEVLEFTKLYSELVNTRKKIEEINLLGEEKNRKIELLSFAISEILDAKIKPNEDEDLAVEEKKLSQFEQIFSDVENILEILIGTDSENFSIISALKKVQSILSVTANADSSLSNLANRLENTFYELSDITDEIKTYKHSLFFDPERLEYVQERSALLFKLKKKYATTVQSSISEVVNYADQCQKELDVITNAQENFGELLKNVEILEKKVISVATNLSEKRRLASEKMSKEIESILSALGMKDAKFVVSITSKPENEGGLTRKCGPYGFDDIEFLISANLGSPVKPLAKIASGGELSRVMLALKTVLSELNTVPTLIFDEIDTGIGGEISIAVGSHLKELSKFSQIFCITHMASIAAYADNQIKISKSSETNITKTKVHAVEGQERVEEIARMLAGDSISNASLEHASQLLSKFGGNNG